MFPPQASPTANASSFETPYSKIIFLPVFKVFNASIITAPSTHPPDTEPIIFPSPLTAN